MSLMPIGLTGFPVLPGAQPGVVSLLINGTIYEGFTDVEISRSAKEMAGQFSIHVSEKWSGGTNGPAVPLTWRIRPSDACQVFYSGLLAVTGRVDAYMPRYAKAEHDVTIQGRSKTGNLCDSSVDGEVPKGEQKKVALDALARKVTRRFGIDVVVEADMAYTIDIARVEPSETVQEFLEYFARSAGVCLTDDQAGRLRLLQVEDGAAVAHLIEGVNIVEASAILRSDNRHSKIQAHGQRRGTDEKHGEQVSRVVGTVTDQSVTEHRPLRLLNESAADERDAKGRAAWEAAARAGESTRVEIKTVDWVRPGGALWMPGEIVHVKSPMLAVDRTLAIESVRLKQSRSNGTTADLTLVPPEALNPKAGKSGGKPGNDKAWTDVKPIGDPDTDPGL